jgi:hypothetical protein
MHRKSHGKSVPKTNFAGYSHHQLYAMLHAGEEETVRSAADSWDGVAARLHEQAGNLEVKLAKFREQWQGGAAEQYQVMINDLAGGLRRIGDAAFAVRDIAHDSADALAKAKAEMPPPVAVPEISPMTVRLATAQLEVDPTVSAEAVARLRQQQADAIAEVKDYQQAAQQSSAAHAKAVAVMNQLAGVYRQADQAIPHTGADEQVPGVPGSGDPGEVPGGELSEDDLLPDTGSVEEAKPKPVFGNMFTAGLAAASAAAAGRLGLPRIPAWATKKEAAAEKKDPAKEKAGEIDKLAGGAFGGGGAGKFGGAGIGAPPVPTAHGGMLGAGPAAGSTVAGLGAVAAAGGAAGAAGAGAMPMMPFMPFAPMGFDMAGSRRVPPWLVETEEVWGESSIITPPVIGEDPPEQPNPSAGYQF